MLLSHRLRYGPKTAELKELTNTVVIKLHFRPRSLLSMDDRHHPVQKGGRVLKILGLPHRHQPVTPVVGPKLVPIPVDFDLSEVLLS